MTMLAYLLSRDRTIALVGGKDGLRWQSEDPRLASDAERWVPLASIPESGGNPAAWAIARLKEFLPGTSCVLAGNIAPGDRDYMMGPMGDPDVPLPVVTKGVAQDPIREAVAVECNSGEDVTGIAVYVNARARKCIVDVLDWGDPKMGKRIGEAAEEAFGPDAVEYQNEGSKPTGPGWLELVGATLRRRKDCGGYVTKAWENRGAAGKSPTGLDLFSWHNADTGETRVQHTEPGHGHDAKPAARPPMRVPRTGTPPSKQSLLRRIADKIMMRKPPQPEEPAEPDRGEVTNDPHTLTNAMIREATFKPPPRHTNSLHDAAIGRVSAGGKEFFWKGCGAKAGAIEHAMSDLCRADSVKCPSVRHTAVPKAPVENKKDPTGVLAEFVDAPSLAHILGGRGTTTAEKAEQFRKEVLPKLEPGEVDRIALFNMMTASSDRHAGNYLLANGHLIAIDNEYSTWDGMGEGEHDTLQFLDCDPLKWASGMDLHKPDADLAKYKVDPGAIRDMAEAAPKMAEAVRARYPKTAAAIEQQGQAFAKWAESGDTTLAGLKNVGGGRVKL